jgi:hypothetical protein
MTDYLHTLNSLPLGKPPEHAGSQVQHLFSYWETNLSSDQYKVLYAKEAV